MPSELQNNLLWWNGPEFLSRRNLPWPTQPNAKIHRDDVEFRKSEIVLLKYEHANCTTSNSVFDKYSNLMKLL